VRPIRSIDINETSTKRIDDADSRRSPALLKILGQKRIASHAECRIDDGKLFVRDKASE
jgi:hypothetical protein